MRTGSPTHTQTYLQEGSRVYMCLYDLQKAFDSIEFPVLLKRLFDAGVDTKTWRIMRSWYMHGLSNLCTSGTTCVSSLLTWAWCASGVYTLTFLVPACNGSSPQTTSVPLSWHICQRNVCRRLPACRRHPHLGNHTILT